MIVRYFENLDAAMVGNIFYFDKDQDKKGVFSCVNVYVFLINNESKSEFTFKLKSINTNLSSMVLRT